MMQNLPCNIWNKRLILMQNKDFQTVYNSGQFLYVPKTFAGENIGTN